MHLGIVKISGICFVKEFINNFQNENFFKFKFQMFNLLYTHGTKLLIIKTNKFAVYFFLCGLYLFKV